LAETPLLMEKSTKTIL